MQSEPEFVFYNMLENTVIQLFIDQRLLTYVKHVKEQDLSASGNQLHNYRNIMLPEEFLCNLSLIKSSLFADKKNIRLLHSAQLCIFLN